MKTRPARPQKKAADRVDAELDQIDVDPCCPCGFLVAADRVDVPSETSSVQHKRSDTDDAEQDNDWYRDWPQLFLSKDAVPRLQLVDGIDMVPHNEAAKGVHGPQGNDQGWQSAPGDQVSVEEAADQPKQKGHTQGKRDVDGRWPLLGEQPRENTGDGQDRPY